MNADDAFGRLMRENNLAIPVAKGDAAVPVPRHPHVDSASAALRVEGVTDIGDEYLPDIAADNGGFSSHPTETGLASVDEEEVAGDEYDFNVEAAEEGGARIIGRDAAAKAPIPPSPPPVPDAPKPTPVAASRRGALLANARRVKRFAFLPLAGNEEFESAAMELAVSLAAADPERPSLLLTSASRGEGRTEMAIRLALAMAKRVGARVLLADFDLKNPRIASRLGLAVNNFSLADALRGTCPLEDALTVSDEDNLYVLPARPSDRAGDEIVESRHAASLFAGIHAAFDFTVVDAGPVEQSEAQILCRLVGGVAVTGFGGQTTAGRLERAAARAESLGGRVAGMLLAGL